MLEMSLVSDLHTQGLLPLQTRHRCFVQYLTDKYNANQAIQMSQRTLVPKYGGQNVCVMTYNDAGNRVHELSDIKKWNHGRDLNVILHKLFRCKRSIIIDVSNKS